MGHGKSCELGQMNDPDNDALLKLIDSCPAVAMWDSGANFNMCSQNFAEKMKLIFTSRQTRVALIGNQDTSQIDTIELLDRNGNLHQVECCIVDQVTTTKVQSMNPKAAAAIFRREPHEFD